MTRSRKVLTLEQVAARRAYAKEYRRTHKQELAAYRRQWLIAHPDYHTQWRRRRHEAEVDAIMQPSTIPQPAMPELIDMYHAARTGQYTGPCTICGEHLTKLPRILLNPETGTLQGIVCLSCYRKHSSKKA
jgi:hypothetical protein